MELDPGLLAAVIAAPDDDAPRQIAADWFDDHGENARAEFIRSQLVEAHGPEHALGVVRARRRAAALLRAHGHRWRHDLPMFPHLAWGELDRGFVGTVRAHAVGPLFAHAETLWAHQPIHTVELVPRVSVTEGWSARPLPIRKLRIVSGDQDYPVELSEAELDAMRGLVATVHEVEIVIYDEYDDGYLRLFDAAELPNLRVFRVRGLHTSGTVYARRLAELEVALDTLDLGTSFIDYDSGYFEDPTLGEDGARRLARAEGLAGLRHLGLDLQRLGPQGLAAILDAFRRLETLSVSRSELSALPTLPEGAPIASLRLGTNEIRAAGLDFLDSPRTATLRHLDLSKNELTNVALARVVAAPGWSSLRHLDLSDHGLTGAGAVFAEAEPPAELHTLKLDDCDLTPDDLDALLALPWVQRLDGLGLRQSELGEAVGRLAACRIRVLGLSNTGLDDAQIAQAHPGLRHCEGLDLSHNEVGRYVPALLGDAPELTELQLRGVVLKDWSPHLGRGAPKLTTLGLAATELGDAGLAALLESALGKQLAELDLTRCNLGPAAIDALVAWPRLGELNRLILLDNADLDDESLVRLARALPRPLPVLRVPGYRWNRDPATNALFDERFGADWDIGEWEP